MVLAALCLSTIGIFVKLIGNNVPIMSLNFLRIFIGFMTLLLIVPFLDGKWYKITKKDSKNFFIVGLLFAIALSLYTAANVYTPIQNAVLINHTYPFFILFFAYFLLKERLTRIKLITLVTAFIALAIINPFQMGENNFGNMLALGSAFFYGLLIVKIRKEGKTHTVGDVIWFLLFASIITLPFVFIQGFGNIAQVWHYVLLLGIVSTGLAYLFYNLALAKIEAEVGSIIAIIVSPLSAIILAILILGELITLRTIIGGTLLILAGIYLQTHNKKLLVHRK